MYLPNKERGTDMIKEGIIGIPTKEGKCKGYRYKANAYKRRDKKGIDGGKIVRLTIERDDEVVCYFDNGWKKEPKDEGTEKALAIIVYSHN